ncbi:DUF4142 domain-containing protein [Legionella saoudiensis]|uniref:DUF4142 domain-containing protein n=1 Tax=Legionella saoudiensis TaxID=1750561 RepID=UPI0007312DD2|nr:DUF4142 domain-containing protein [Legionella saoudiensis]
MNARKNFFSFLVVLFFINAFFFIKTSNAVQTKKDSEILTILITADEGEIAAANEVLNKSLSPQVKNYAQMLKKEHTENLNKAMELSKNEHIGIVSTAITNSLKQHNKKELSQLSTLKNKELEKEYIKMMIRDHEQVLHMMDHSLLRNVSNPALGRLLLETRPKLEKHLKEAKLIQKKLTD